MTTGESPLKVKGKLRVLSPVEPNHAMLIAMRHDVDIGDEPTLYKWLSICLSSPMLFKVYENNEAYHFAHLQLRENAGIDYELLRHTALQLVLCHQHHGGDHVPEVVVLGGAAGGLRQPPKAGLSAAGLSANSTQ